MSNMPESDERRERQAARRREVEIWFWLLLALIAGCLGSLLLAPHLLRF